MSHFLQNSLNLKLPNCVLLSVIKIFSIPNLMNIFLLMNDIAYCEVIDCTASTSAHLLKCSIAMITNFLNLGALGNGSRMSSLYRRMARGFQLLIALTTQGIFGVKLALLTLLYQLLCISYYNW